MGTQTRSVRRQSLSFVVVAFVFAYILVTVAVTLQIRSCLRNAASFAHTQMIVIQADLRPRWETPTCTKRPPEDQCPLAPSVWGVEVGRVRTPCSSTAFSKSPPVEREVSGRCRTSLLRQCDTPRDRTSSPEERSSETKPMDQVAASRSGPACRGPSEESVFVVKVLHGPGPTSCPVSRLS